MKDLKIKLHYNDKEIEVNGTTYHKNKDDNGPEVDGVIGMQWLEEIVDLAEFEEMEQRAKNLGFTQENFYEATCDDKHFLIPLKEPKDIDKDTKEEMYYYGKDKYFDLYLLGQHILAEQELPKKIKKMKKGATFTFTQFFKDYTIVDKQEQFEIYSKVLGQVNGLIKVDENAYKTKRVQAYEHSLETYDLPQQITYVRVWGLYGWK